MKGEDIVRQVADGRKEGQFFIRWWRKEEDWLDFDLIDTFLANAKPDEEIGGYDLLTMEEMWEYVRKVGGNRVARTTRKGEEVILWQKEPDKETVCQFTPDSLLKIFDVESRGNYVD
ncbi:MAG TPA: hypothetical protein VF775_04775 [Geobacteraceae bacterium]